MKIRRQLTRQSKTLFLQMGNTTLPSKVGLWAPAPMQQSFESTPEKNDEENEDNNILTESITIAAPRKDTSTWRQSNCKGP